MVQRRLLLDLQWLKNLTSSEKKQGKKAATYRTNIYAWLVAVGT